MKTATIVGAGLVGSLWAVYLSKAGYKVSIFERRSDIRKADISAGKSINLALSYRGWKALKGAGVDDAVKEIALPIKGRAMHDKESNLSYQPYGQEGQFIYSVARGGLNVKLLTIAENTENVTLHFNEQCTGADLDNGLVYLENSITGKKTEHKSDVVFACDGAFSAIRYNSMQKQSRFNYSQEYIEDGYRELLLPANEDGSYKIDKNYLHIWPRGRFMLMALPNEDGSFTCTLFMPYAIFDTLKTKADVDAFFRKTFPDFYDIMPDLADYWDDFPLSSLAIIRCYPWAIGKVALMGDSAHATVPFYGQGMNAGFEDCTVLHDLMLKHNENWEKVFEEYKVTRKPDGDGLQDLSKHNYLVMRDYVGDPQFLLQKKFEHRIQELYPEKYLPLYSMVTFSHIRYSEAWNLGMAQEEKIKALMAKHNVKEHFESSSIDALIHELVETNQL